MKMSTSIASLASALAKAKGEFGKVTRNKTVTVRSDKGSYTFSYAPLDSIVDATEPALIANGLSVIQNVGAETLTTLMAHSSGEWIETDPMPIRTQGNGAQAFGSGITYAKRYQYCALLGIVADEDDDGNGADGNTAKPAAKAAPAKPESAKPVSVATWEALPAERQKFLSELAADVVDLLGQEKAILANELIAGSGLDADDKVALWSQFDSKQRSALKAAKQ